MAAETTSEIRRRWASGLERYQADADFLIGEVARLTERVAALEGLLAARTPMAPAPPRESEERTKPPMPPNVTIQLGAEPPKSEERHAYEYLPGMHDISERCTYPGCSMPAETHAINEQNDSASHSHSYLGLECHPNHFCRLCSLPRDHERHG